MVSLAFPHSQTVAAVVSSSQIRRLHIAAAAGKKSPPPPPPLDDGAIVSLVLKTEAQKLAVTLEHAGIQWTPDRVDRILKLLWNDGPKALVFFSSLERHPSYAHAASSFNHAIDISARIHHYKRMWYLFQRMRRLRLGPSAKTFAIVAERFTSAGNPNKAVKLFLSLHNHGCPQSLSSFNTLLDVLCKSRKMDIACNTFRLLSGRLGSDTVTYNILASGWCSLKKTPMALELLREMVERGLSPTLTTYNIMLNGFFRAGQVREAWGFFKEMKKRRDCEVDVVTYTTVIHGMGSVGLVQKAWKVFREMTGEGVLPSVATYNAMMQVLCRKGSTDDGLFLLEEMVRRGYTPNSSSYNTVIRGFGNRGEMGRAMAVLEMMREGGCEPNVQTYNVLIRSFCEDGKIEEGLGLLEKMRRSGCLPNLDTYNVLISATFVTKKREGMVTAGRLLMEMGEKGFWPRKFVYNRILNGLLMTGNQPFAREIIRVQSEYCPATRRISL